MRYKNTIFRSGTHIICSIRVFPRPTQQLHTNLLLWPGETLQSSSSQPSQGVGGQPPRYTDTEAMLCKRSDLICKGQRARGLSRHSAELCALLRLQAGARCAYSGGRLSRCRSRRRHRCRCCRRRTAGRTQLHGERRIKCRGCIPRTGRRCLLLHERRDVLPVRLQAQLQLALRL